MPDFKNIRNEIFSELASKARIFLGVGHKDKDFNKFLSVFLKQVATLNKNKIVVFAEYDPKEFNDWCSSMGTFKNAERLLTSQGKQFTFDTMVEICTPRNEANQNSSIEFLALLLMLRLSDMVVIPFNYIPTSEADKQDHDKAHNILYGGLGPNTTLQALHWATAKRVSQDEAIADRINATYDREHGDKKCIVIGGPAHVKISQKLQINAINVMPTELYKKILLGSAPAIIQDLCSSGVTSYSYDDGSIQPVDWRVPGSHQSIATQHLVRHTTSSAPTQEATSSASQVASNTLSTTTVKSPPDTTKKKDDDFLSGLKGLKGAFTK